MELKRRRVEADVKRFYSDSSRIEEQLRYLERFHDTPESWEVCLAILKRHSASSERSAGQLEAVLLYSAVTLKLHAYNAFRHQLARGVGSKYARLWRICEALLELLSSYSGAQTRVGLQLASALACAVAYSFQHTQSASRLLLLAALRRTREGSAAQLLYLAALAREAWGPGLALPLHRRAEFVRTCAALAPSLLPCLLGQRERLDLAIEQLRLDALAEWLALLHFLLSALHPLALERRFLEAFEFVCEDLMLPRRRVSDVALVRRFLEGFADACGVGTLLRFLKYSIGSGDEELMRSSCELAERLLSVCQLDLPGLLLGVGSAYSEQPLGEEQNRWGCACSETLSNLPQALAQIVEQLVRGVCEVAAALLECGQRDKKMRFIKPHLSNLLLDLLSRMASEHLPFALHFGLVSVHELQLLCRFVNLYLYSDAFALRKAALEFWEALHSHLCPRRKQLSYTSTLALENAKEHAVTNVAPMFQRLVADVYRSCTICQGDDLEALVLYRQLAECALKMGVQVAGLDSALTLIGADVELVSLEPSARIAERVTFATAALATSLAGKPELVRSVVAVAFDLLEMRFKISPSHAPAFYRNSAWKLVLWTSAFICGEQHLMHRCTRLVADQLQMGVREFARLDEHVYLDQALLGLCFSMPSGHPLFGQFVGHLIGSITANLAPVEKRMEILEAFVSVLDSLEPQESKKLKMELVTSLYHKQPHYAPSHDPSLSNSAPLSHDAHSQLFLLCIICTINFADGRELDEELVRELVKELRGQFDSQEGWVRLCEIMLHTPFTDESGADFSSNSLLNNKSSFISWLLACFEPCLTHVCVLKLLLKHAVRAATGLYRLLLAHLVAISSEYLTMLSSGVDVPYWHALDLLESIGLIFTRIHQTNLLVQWDRLPEFITALADSLPNELSALNISALLLIARFVGWADFPKQMLKDKQLELSRAIKGRVRAIINGREGEVGVAPSVVEAIVRATVSRAEGMHSWIAPGSQALWVLLRCAQTSEAAQESLKHALRVGLGAQACRNAAWT